MRMKSKLFSGKKQPEVSPGLYESEYLFDDFVSMIEEMKTKQIV